MKIITVGDERYMMLGKVSVDCGYTVEELKTQWRLADTVLRNGNEFYYARKENQDKFLKSLIGVKPIKKSNKNYRKIKHFKISDITPVLANKNNQTIETVKKTKKDFLILLKLSKLVILIYYT